MCVTPVYMGSLYVHLPRRLASKGLLTAFLALLTLAFPARHIPGAEPACKVQKDTLSKGQDTEANQAEKSLRLGIEKRLYVPDNDDGPGDALLKMALYSLLIVVLGVLALVVLKRLVPKIQRSAGKNLSIIETAYISPRSSIHLLRAGTRKYLISRSGDGLSLLAEVTQALHDEETTPGSAE